MCCVCVFLNLYVLCVRFSEFVVVAESENNSYSFSFNVNYKNEISVTQNLISPENNSEKLNLFPELKWEKNENIDKFRLQVSKKEDFTNLELDETLYNNSYQLSDLNSDQVYFWRVQPINICGTGDFSNYNIFKTDKISCIDYYSSNLPINNSLSFIIYLLDRKSVV